MGAPTLNSSRLILRNWDENDISLFAALNADPRVMEFFPSTLSKEESDKLAGRIIKELSEKKYGYWAVILKETNQFIGFVGLHYQDFKAHFTPCIEMGWRLAFHAWGHGYAYEAATTVLDYAFTVLNLDEVVAYTTKTNMRSRRLMEKLHMKRNEKDDFPHPRLADNHPLQSHVLYRLKNPFR